MGGCKRYLAGGVVAVLLATGLAGATGSFTPATSYTVNASPAGIATGDFNGDGKLDIASATSGAIWIIYGYGAGQFSSPSPTGMMGTVTAIASGDVNGDGRTDIAVAGNNSLSMLFSNGNGFAQQSWPAGTNPTALAIADLNGDGFNDVAVTTGGMTGLVMTFFGNPMNLSPGGSYSTGSSPQGITLGDFNGDSFVDVATANASNSVSVLQGAGNGTFSLPTSVSLTNPGYAIATGTFDGGNTLDLAVVSSPGMGNGGVTILLNSMGSFSPFGFFPTGANTRALAVADYNGDSKADVAVANAGNDTVTTLFGSGFGGLSVNASYPVGSSPDGLAAADLDSNGTIDLASANYFSKDVSILLNIDPPGTPANLSATAGPGVGQINLSWQPPLGGGPVAYYNIYRGTTPNSESPWSIAFSTSYIDQMLSNGTTYYYKVTAVNGAGESALSNEASATTFDRPTPPANFVAAPGTAVGAITLTWMPPPATPALTGYRVCRGTTSGVEPFCGTLPANATSFTDGGLLPFTSYYYVLYASNVIGESNASVEVCARPFPWVSQLGC